MNEQEKMNKAGSRCEICNAIKEQDYKYEDICENCSLFVSKYSASVNIETIVYYFKKEQEKSITRLERYLLKSGIDFDD